MARLTADFWVRAYLARLRLAAIPAFVRAHGDDGSGAVVVKLNTLNGQAQAFQRSFTLDGGRPWIVLAEGDDSAVEQALARQMQRDRDLWVIEVEDASGRTLLDEPGLGD